MRHQSRYVTHWHFVTVPYYLRPSSVLNVVKLKSYCFQLQLEMEQDDVIEVYQEQTGGKIQP